MILLISTGLADSEIGRTWLEWFFSHNEPSREGPELQQSRAVAHLLSALEEFASRETLLFVGRLLRDACAFSVVDDRIFDKRAFGVVSSFGRPPTFRPHHDFRMPFESVGVLLQAGIVCPSRLELDQLISDTIIRVGGCEMFALEEFDIRYRRTAFGFRGVNNESTNDAVLRLAKVLTRSLLCPAFRVLILSFAFLRNVKANLRSKTLRCLLVSILVNRRRASRKHLSAGTQGSKTRERRKRMKHNKKRLAKQRFAALICWRCC